MHAGVEQLTSQQRPTASRAAASASGIASGICIALAVDLSRIPIYINEGYFDLDEYLIKALVIAIFCAFGGAIAGKTLINKIKVKVLYNIIAYFLMLFAILLMIGLI